MKELTIEEKAKAYDEAVESLRAAFYDDNNRMCDEYRKAVIRIIEPIFPELKESEDDKIRKELIRIVDIWTNSAPIVNGIPREKLLAYLEKQCKQKPADKVEPKFKVGDIIKPKDRGHEPWQIMQVDILDKKYRFKDGYVIHFSQEDNYELVEQKPAWSEDDERMIDTIISDLERHGGKEGSCYSTEINFLKSLKDRVGCEVNCTTTKEWSEEDKMMLQYAIEHFEHQKRNCVEGGGRKKAMQEFIDWLKSLRPQSKWKPSGEQLHYLSWIANIKLGDGVVEQEVSKHLNELLEDLKKLKE